MTNGWLGAIVAVIVALFGGGGVGVFLNSRRIGRKISVEADAIGAKTPVDVESVAVSTMRTALESSQSQVKQLEAAALASDARHDKERAEWAAERATMRAEFDALEVKLRTALDDLAALRKRHDMTDDVD